MSAGHEAPLDVAVHELLQHWSACTEIVRVDVGDAGGLVLTAVGGGADGLPLTRWFSHDDRGLIERFPERDAKLPLAQRLAATSDWRALSYRPGRRAVALVRRGELLNVVKGHKKSRSARAAVNQGLAEGAMRRAGLRVPRLLLHDAALEALVFEHLPGREVALDGSSAPLYAALGRGLAVFQEDERAAELKLHGPREEFAVLERWREKVLAAARVLPAGWLAGEARLRECAGHLPPPRLGLAHRDLHDRQVHAQDGQVALLDFDLLCRADVALDAGNLVAHLRWRALQGLHGADADSTRALEQAFLAALGRAGEPGFEARLAFHLASALLRLALVYRLRPRWSARVDELVVRANGVLDELTLIG